MNATETESKAEIVNELPVRDGYAAWSSLYDIDGNPLIVLEGPAMAAWFGDLRGRAAIDLGCGTGRHTLALARGGATVTAVDLTPEMIAIARAKLKPWPVRWIEHELPACLPLGDQRFDIAVLGLVVEHVDDLDALFRETARLLKPGGKAIVSALHPERTAEGQRARFIDPTTGQRRPIRTIHRTEADYRKSARSARLRLLGENTLVVDEATAAKLPRAVPYLGLPLGWVACWETPDR